MRYTTSEQQKEAIAARMSRNRDEEDLLKPSAQLDLYRTFSYYSTLHNRDNEDDVNVHDLFVIGRDSVTKINLLFKMVAIIPNCTCIFEYRS